MKNKIDKFFIADSKFCFEHDWFDKFIEIPRSERLKSFEVKRDRDYIESVHERVTKVREYLAKKQLTVTSKAA